MREQHRIPPETQFEQQSSLGATSTMARDVFNKVLRIVDSEESEPLVFGVGGLKRHTSNSAEN